MSEQSFNPRTGRAFGPRLPATTEKDYERILGAAHAAATPWDRQRGQRPAALRAAADALDGAGDVLVTLAVAETGLGHQRLAGELARATWQWRFFAQLVEDGQDTDVLVDETDDRPLPMGHPELRRVFVPLGPAAAFAASNFPFAFGVAGTDTASALAAGCPLVVKTNPGHPQLSDEMSTLIGAALLGAGTPVGTFDVVRGLEVGVRLVGDPRIRAATFTGSAAAGRALFDVATRRPDPIPFYGELGSVNPVFVTGSAAARLPSLIEGYLDSLLLGAGQFCTNPGLLVLPRTPGLRDAIAERVALRPQEVFLGPRIAKAYFDAVEQLSRRPYLRPLFLGAATSSEALVAQPAIFTLDISAALTHAQEIQEECFGPAGLIVEYDSPDDLLAFTERLNGCLVAGIHADVGDPVAESLLRALSRVAGRVVWNGWPTNVAVSVAQQHGGPYPASTNPLHTSVGGAAIRRFQRPVALQSVPLDLLPAEWR